MFVEHWYTLKSDVSETPTGFTAHHGNITATDNMTFEQLRVVPSDPINQIRSIRSIRSDQSDQLDQSD